MIPLAQEPLEAPWVQAKAREIVAGLQPEEPGESWLARFLDWISIDPEWGTSLGVGPELVLYFLYALAAALVGWLLFLLVRELDLRRRRAGESQPALVRVRERVEALLQRARAERAAGRRLAALRLYFLALVVALSKRGDLEYREAWTNGELVARGAHTDELRATLAPLVRELDALVYGGQEVTEAHLDRLEGWCRRVEA